MSTASHPAALAALLEREPGTTHPENCRCVWCSVARQTHARTPRVVVDRDAWQPQLLTAVFRKGQLAIHTQAAGHLFYFWPTNEFQDVAPAEGQRVWCLFDPITAEEIMVFAEPAGKEDPVFLGVAEVIAAEEEVGS